MQILKRNIFIFIFLISLGFINTFNSYALDTKIAFSDPSVIQGNEVNVVLKISSLSGENLGNTNLLLKYDTNYIEFISGNAAQGGEGTIKISALEDGKQEWVYNLKFKALKAGETKIEISSDEVYDSDGKTATISQKGSSKITITPGATISNNAKLSSLSIDGFSLNPEFNEDIDNYNVDITEDISSLVINTVAQDANATIEIKGNENFVDGENKIEIKVLAADNSTSKVYTINAIRENKKPISNIQISVLDKTIYLFEPEADVKIPKGLKQTEVEVNGAKVKAWVDEIDAGKNFVLVYGKNVDGELGFYSYDLKEKTLQRYFGTQNEDLNNKYKSSKNTCKILTYILYLLVLVIILLIALIVYLFKKIKRNNDFDDKAEIFEEDENEASDINEDKLELESLEDFLQKNKEKENYNEKVDSKIDAFEEKEETKENLKEDLKEVKEEEKLKEEETLDADLRRTFEEKEEKKEEAKEEEKLKEEETSDADLERAFEEKEETKEEVKEEEKLKEETLDADFEKASKDKEEVEEDQELDADFEIIDLK